LSIRLNKAFLINLKVSPTKQYIKAKLKPNKYVLTRCGKRKEINECPFRLYAAWMFKERSFQIKSMTDTHCCARKFKFGSMVSPEWIGRHYMTEIANKPKV